MQRNTQMLFRLECHFYFENRTEVACSMPVRRNVASALIQVSTGDRNVLTYITFIPSDCFCSTCLLGRDEFCR